ncbi:MAG: serine/threonine-protein kinase [Lysobacteraceae bacterium]
MKHSDATLTHPGSSLDQAARQQARLAVLAFASGPDGQASRHLAFQDIDDLDLDLDDPQQRRLGDYELIEKLGQGGMGVVYRARQLSLDRHVALKLLAAGPWASSDFVHRFRREAQNAARLQHPNIVAVHEAASEHDLHFFSMRLVDGPSLAQHLRKHPLSTPHEAAQRMLAVAEAVDYAHRMGVLHLDIKPGNILIDARGEMLVADFGLARRLDQALGSDNLEVSGTPSYMAPEQASIRSHRLSRATDVWGLGAVLFEMLTGEPPFHGATPQATLAQVRDGAVRRPGSLRRDIPRDLDAICLKCLERDPAQRYGSARELADDLARFLDGRPVSVRPLNPLQRGLRWARREPKLAGSLALAVVTLIAGLIATSLQWQRAERHAGDLRANLWAQRLDAAEAALRAGEPLAALPLLADNLVEQEYSGESESARVSRLRIAAALGQAPALIDRIANGDLRIHDLLLDPQGQWLISIGDDTLRRFDLPGGTQRWETRLSAGALSLTDDGRHVLVTGFDASAASDDFLRLRGGGYQVMVDLETGAPDALSAEALAHPEQQIALNYSRDASHVLSGRLDPQSGNWQFEVRDLASGQPIGPPWPAPRGTQLLAPGAAALALGHFSADVSGFYVERLELRDPRDFSLRWTYRHGADSGIRAWEFSSDGQTLAIGHYSGEVRLLDVASGTARALSPPFSDAVYALHFSADGQWLAAAASDGEIRLFDLASGRLLFAPLHPDSTPGMLRLDRDSASLLTLGNGQARLWRLDEAAGRIVPVLDRFPAHTTTISAAAPGQGLLATGGSDGEVRLWRLRTAQAHAANMAPSPPADAPLQGALALVAIDDARLRLLDPASGTPIGPEIVHPQAIGLAALRAGSTDIHTVAGPMLYGHDGRSGAALFAPQALPVTPSALLPSPDGEHLLLAYNARDGRNNELVLERHDARNGKRMASLRLPGSYRRLRFSRHGNDLLVWRDNELHVIDSVRMTPRHELLRFGENVAAHRQRFHDGEEASPLPAQLDVRAAALSGDGRKLWLSLGRGGEDGYQLRLLELPRGQERLRITLPHFALDMALLDGGERAVLLMHGNKELLIVDATGDILHVPVEGIDDASRLAVSPDGRILAVSTAQGVHLLDARDGAWVAPPVPLPQAATRIDALVFDADGQALSVHTSEGLVWRIAATPDSRPADALQRMARMLNPPLPNVARTAVATDEERRALRAADPGAPLPSPAAQRRWNIDFPVAEARFVDLRPACNLHYHDPADHLWLDFLHLRQFPAPGRHRLLGQDYELRCGVLASWRPDAVASVEHGSRIENIAVAPQTAAAIHLLATAGSGLRLWQTEAPYAHVEIGYADGSHARAALLWRRDIHLIIMPIPDATSATPAYSALGGIGTAMSPHIPHVPHLYATRVENPHPERRIVSLAWESVPAPHSHPLLMAATLEPLPDPRSPPPH